MTFGHKIKQTNPLKGMLYIIACFLFGFAMYKLGVGQPNGTWDDKVLAGMFFSVAIVVWAIGIILLMDLFKYFKSN